MGALGGARHMRDMVRLLAFLLLLPAFPVAISAGEPGSVLPDPIHLCGVGKRITCVVDGDTFWLEGAKIRIADINTPETSRAGCPSEAELGARATLRLADLLNRGPFSLRRDGRDADRYGRKLRVITRGGTSLGQMLVDEGLAERWNGRRRDWCAAS